jgi:hypothetical protein
MVWVIEKPRFVDDSESGNEFRRTYHFGVGETQSSSVAHSICRNYFGPVISTANGVLFVADVRITSTAYNQFDVDVDYLRRPSEAGEWSWEMDGTGRTEHITHSIETIASYPTSTAPDMKNAIGFDKDEIQGTDVIKPSAKFSIRFVHPPGFMTIQYANYLSLLAGYVNSQPWLVWDAGEVRFLGPRASDGSQTKSECHYAFEIERNRSNFSVGAITGVIKKGWHYSWTKSELGTATAGGKTYPTKVPKFVYVERVSEEINFSTAFGIS